MICTYSKWSVRIDYNLHSKVSGVSLLRPRLQLSYFCLEFREITNASNAKNTPAMFSQRVRSRHVYQHGDLSSKASKDPLK